jgi:hypothetical protein
MIECVVLQLMISPTLMVQEICHHLDQGSKDQISQFRRDLINSFQAQTNHHFNKGLIKDSPLVQARCHFFLDQTSHFNRTYPTVSTRTQPTVSTRSIALLYIVS